MGLHRILHIAGASLERLAREIGLLEHGLPASAKALALLMASAACVASVPDRHVERGVGAVVAVCHEEQTDHAVLHINGAPTRAATPSSRNVSSSVASCAKRLSCR